MLYPLIQELRESEIHSFEELSADELLAIAQEESPKAVGMGRHLKKTIEFDLSLTEIPEQGEISACGGRLSRINNHALVWTTRIESIGACELRVYFSEGFFPAGVKVNFFTDTGMACNQPELNGKIGADGFFTSTVFADHVILQLIIPPEATDAGLYFKIPMIIHVDATCLNREILRDCYEDVGCEEAGNFPLINNLRSSIAWLLFYISPYYYICTGTLLNDSREKDFQPFLLTAFHCINSNTVAASLEARFDYYTTSCNGPVNENVVLINGSNLMVTNSDTDFAMLLLNQFPSGSRYFNGWITAAVEDDEILHAVHHPGGMTQQYSRLQNKYAPANLCSGTPLTHHYYTRIRSGRLAGGSSGSAIVNNSGQVAGQLKSICLGSGYQPCNFNTYYITWGRFDVSYQQSNLQFWLGNGGAGVAMNVPESVLNFGTVAVGDSAIQIIEIQNSGIVPENLNLEINSLDISGNHANDFMVTENTDLYLPPGQSGFVAVRFIPQNTGYKTTTLSIYHNADNLENPVQIMLQGLVIPPAELLVQNTAIISGQNLCYAASQTITLAGEGSTFVVEEGGYVELLAGYRVILKPGTSVWDGGYLYARIVTDNQYCQNTSYKNNIKDHGISTVIESIGSQDDFSSLIIWPNPSSGRFTIQIIENEDEPVSYLEVLSLTGESILSQKFPTSGNYCIDISHCKPGLYIVRLIHARNSFTRKIILIN